MPETKRYAINGPGIIEREYGNLILYADYEDLKRKLTTCVFCQVHFPDVAALKEHSANCEKHPLAGQVKTLRDALDKVNGELLRIGQHISLSNREGAVRHINSALSHIAEVYALDATKPAQEPTYGAGGNSIISDPSTHSR